MRTGPSQTGVNIIATLRIPPKKLSLLRATSNSKLAGVDGESGKTSLADSHASQEPFLSQGPAQLCDFHKLTERKDLPPAQRK